MKLFNISSKESKSHAVILPKEIVKGFGWKSGDILKHKITGEGKIELSKE